MNLIDLYHSCIRPQDTLMVFDETSSTLFDVDEFILECYKKNISFDTLSKSQVKNICVNGDAIQFEVDIYVK